MVNRQNNGIGIVVLRSDDSDEDDECDDRTNKYSLDLYPEASIYGALNPQLKSSYLCVIRNDCFFAVFDDGSF